MKTGKRHEHLAADLDHARGVLAPQPQRHRRNGPQVVCHVLASPTVTTSRTADEYPVLVSQAYSRTVKLRLGHIRNRICLDPLTGETLSDSFVERLELLL